MATEIDASNLPDLTEKQQAFVNAILEGKNSRDAYKTAYPNNHSNENCIWVEATRLKSHPKISLWLTAARKAGLASAAWTFERYITAMDHAALSALEAGNHGAHVSALRNIGDASGHHTQRVDITIHDPAETLREIAAIAPELAHQLATQAGLNLNLPKLIDHEPNATR